MSPIDPSIFKAYDVRGIYPSQYNEEAAYAIGQAFVTVTGAKKVVVGRDVRAMGPQMQAAIIQGVIDAGADAIDVGVISTEMLYFAAGTLDCDGGMSATASHNPPEWIGTKFIDKGAIPMTRDGKLGQIYERAQSAEKATAEVKGNITHHDLLPEYTAYLKKFIPQDVPALTVVGNTNFGADGKVIDGVLADLPLKFTRLNWNEDGTFPKGTPDPSLPKNRREIAEVISNEGADFGVAWDADADRAFFYDEKGRPFHGCYVVALIAKELLEREPGSTIVYEPRIIWPILAAINESGGKGYMSKTGHTFIKKSLRDSGAIFGGENSGHYYFRDFFFCDNGVIPFLLMLSAFAKQIASGKKVSQILDEYQERFPSSEELNFLTDKSAEIMEQAKAKYSDGELNELEGVSLEFPDWRFNLRRSNTEPVLRLCMEAHSRSDLEQRQAEMIEYIESFGAKLRNDN